MLRGESHLTKSKLFSVFCQQIPSVYRDQNKTMPKKIPPSDFQIHVDPFCITDSTDIYMAPECISSKQTLVHHDIGSEEGGVKEEVLNHMEFEIGKSCSREFFYSFYSLLPFIGMVYPTTIDSCNQYAAPPTPNM